VNGNVDALRLWPNSRTLVGNILHNLIGQFVKLAFYDLLLVGTEMGFLGLDCPMTLAQLDPHIRLIL
jgi:hypothetical protein